MILKSFILALAVLGFFKPAVALNQKELTIALNSEFETLNPIVNSMMASIYILDATLRPVVAMDPAGKVTAYLIKEIPTLENKKAQLIKVDGKQGLKASIEFIAGANWGDGTPVTCKDLQAAWEIGKDPMVSTPQREEFLNIHEFQIDAKDPKKCAVIFKEAKWNFYLNFPRPVPAHLELKILETNKGKAQGYERNSLYVREVSNPGLYNGPYLVKEWKPGSHIMLEKNPKFFGKAPSFEKLIFKFLTNTAAIESHLRSGSVMMTSASGMSFDQALAFEKKVKAGKLPFEVLIVPGVMYSHLDFNMDHPVLADVKVRQALAHAVDRKQMVKAFFENRQHTALHFSPEIDSWFTEDPKEIKIYDFSKAKATALLDEAGWKPGSDGIRVKDGKRFSLTIVGAADNKLNEILQSYIQGAWKSIGVELIVRNYPARVLFGEILRKRQFELGLYSFVSAPDSTQRNTLHSSMIPSEQNSWSGSNRPGWKNKLVDQWLDAAEVEFNPAKRKTLMRKVLRAYTEDLPALPLYYRANNAVIPAGLKGYRLSGHVFTEYLEVENWGF